MATQEQLNRINEAIAIGATSVSYNGRTVSYRSLEEMKDIRDALQRELNPTTAVNRMLYPIYNRA